MATSNSSATAALCLYTVFGFDNANGERRLVHIIAESGAKAVDRAVEMLSEDYAPVLVLKGGFVYSDNEDGDEQAGWLPRPLKVDGIHDPLVCEAAANR